MIKLAIYTFRGYMCIKWKVTKVLYYLNWGHCFPIRYDVKVLLISALAVELFTHYNFPIYTKTGTHRL